MRRLAITALSLIFISSAVLADVPSYSLVKDKSSLKFYAIENNAPIEGKFTDYTAEIHFDPDMLDKSSIKVEVNTASVATANDDVNSNIKTPDWLSVELFPKAVFISGKITRMPGSDNYYADGKLTLRDKTLPVVLNFQMEHMDAQGAVAKGYVTLRRSDFGVGQGQWAKDDVIKNEVRVEFRIVANKQ